MLLISLWEEARLLSCRTEIPRASRMGCALIYLLRSSCLRTCYQNPASIAVKYIGTMFMESSILLHVSTLRLRSTRVLEGQSDGLRVWTVTLTSLSSKQCNFSIASFRTLKNNLIPTLLPCIHCDVGKAPTSIESACMLWQFYYVSRVYERRSWNEACHFACQTEL